MALQHLRSNTASKRPTAGAMSDGQIAVNTNATSPGLFFKDAGGAIIKVGPVHVGTTAPNSSPAGSTGNSLGEQWLDTSGGGYVLKIWDGSAWRSEVGEFVDAAGDTMTGALILPNGTAAAPALGVGSTDNGIYSPGTDQVAISTNGTGRLFVDASGRVGIGTSAQQYLVHAESANPRIVAVGTSSTSYSSNESRNDTGSSLVVLMRGSAATGATFGQPNANGAQLYSVSADYLSVGTFQSNPLILGTNNTERLRITSTGQIQSGGLGSAVSPALSFSSDTNTGIYSPGADQLALSTNGVERLAIENDGDVRFGSSVNYGWIRGWSPTTGDMIIGADQSATGTGGSNLIFRNRGSERLRITSDGLVGIGTSSPLRSLHVAGAGDTSLMLQTTNAVDDKEIWEIQAAGNASNHADLIFRTRTNAGTGGAEALRITNSGSVGIGTTSASESLSLAEGTALGWNDTSGNNAARIYATSGDELRFERGSTNSRSMTIDSSGRLLVGTSSARTNFASTIFSGTQQIEAANNSSSVGLSITNGSSLGYTAVLALNSHKTNSIGGTGATTNGFTQGQIQFNGSDGTNFIRGAVIAGVADGDWASGDCPGRLVFSTTADGASSPTERMRITNTGYTTTYSTSSGYRFGVSAAAGTSTSLLIGSNSATGVDTGTVSFRVWSNGDVVNTNDSYGAISDIKLKENIVDANSQWDDFKAIRFRKYNFKEETGYETFTQLGVIAQELEQVCPGLVDETPDRDDEGNDLGTTTKSVKYSILTKKALVALQEAMERIETLEASNADLLARVSALEAN